ncbi:LysR family transcriptional regulator [Achromobacter sp. GG226]|uniref:LysR family transcriptional regulator n=1 Tax=Verticiella alkaliphila TaxID=2779529 RepID=UPI001C0D0642|nr:LysR family transcriptional regulator [Verticiella sp. GG226]MBU4609627.1 LysR family transcriptional regulator [Verticiella sp. GG226]
MRDVDLTSLRLFVRVCEAGSITRVAEHANLVGSAISKRLAALEDTLGQRLFVRRRRGVEVTAAGQALLLRAHAILAQCEGIERDMLEHAAGVRGHVRVAATASAIAVGLADDVARFLRDPAHRHIRIELEEALSPDVVRLVREGMAPLGVCWDAADFQGLATRPYRSDQLAVVTARDHPLAGAPQLHFLDTLDEEHVCMPAAAAVTAVLRRAAAQAGRLLVQRVTVSNLDSMLRVVQAGLAISVVPLEAALAYAEARQLAVVPLADAWAQRRFAVCLREEQPLPAAAELVAEWLSSEASTSAAPVDTGAVPPRRRRRISRSPGPD